LQGNADVNARIALDVLAEINGYMTIPTPTERALGACRVWRGYLKVESFCVSSSCFV
jgi:hypothetical protein